MTILQRIFQKKKRQNQVSSDLRGWWGNTGIRLAVGRRGLILIFFSLFCCAVLVLACGQYVRKVQVKGVLEPRGGQVVLVSPDSGTLHRLFVRQGEHVRAGDVLAEISVLRKVSGHDMDGGGVGALRHSIEGFQSTRNLHEQDRRMLSMATTDQWRLLNDETAQAKQELDKNQQAAQVASEELAKLKILVAEGIRSTHELANAEIDYLRATNEILRVRQNITRIEGKKVDLKAQLQREQTALTRQGNETAARIDQLKVELDRALKGESFQIIATQNGVVDFVFSQIGAPIQSGEIVVTLSDPEVSLQALMFIRPPEIGFIRQGDEVLLQIDAFPSQQFGSMTGKIVSVSSIAVANNQFKKLANLNEGERSYMAIVALKKNSMTGYGNDWKLQAGMTYHGYVALERQSLFQWLFNPVFVALGRNPYFFDRLRGPK